MGGETANIADVAKKIALEIFDVFKWVVAPPINENFKCHKAQEHKKDNSEGKFEHTHPADVVFKYFDPYLNKNIYLLTDLKCYASTTIKYSSIKVALESLAKAIDCAQTSPEWQQKYVTDNLPFDVRGLLFIYNHDGQFDKNFYDHFKNIKTEKLPLKANHLIHILDPEKIVFLRSLVQDLNGLQSKNQFPRMNFSFYYPDMTLHKAKGEPDTRPATIEALCSPYIIFRFPSFKYVANESTGATADAPPGTTIYYSRDGSTEFEFMYLLDNLSRLQILSGEGTIQIRVMCGQPSPYILSNFQKAKHLYLVEWGYDRTRQLSLERIEFTVCNFTVPAYMPGLLGWDYD